MLVAVLALVGIGTVAAQSRLIVAQSSDIDGFDVHNSSGTITDGVTINIFDRLLMRTRDGAWEPALAESWERLDDTAWRFSLRNDVTWHDGRQFTAADVEFTLERVAGDGTLAWHDRFSVIREVEVVHDFEVIIHTHEPDAILLNRLAGTGAAIVPRHVIEENGWSAFQNSPIGTGPFRFVEWRRDDRLLFEAYDQHWRGRPAIDELVFRFIPESSTRVGELLTGGVDIAVNVPPQDVDRIRASSTAKVAPQPTNRVMLLLLRTGSGAVTADPRVREAIDYAIDNQLLIDLAMGGLGVPTRARITNGVSAAPADLYNTYLHDPDRAVSLLAEAGYGPGELTVTLQGGSGRVPNDREQAELIAAMLEAVGINVNLEVTEWTAFNDRVWAGNGVVNIALTGLGNSILDGWFALTGYRCNGAYIGNTDWCNPRYDELVDGANAEVDLEQRTAMLHEAFYILTEERPEIGLFQLDNVLGLGADVQWEPFVDELLWMFDATVGD